MRGSLGIALLPLSRLDLALKPLEIRGAQASQFLT